MKQLIKYILESSNKFDKDSAVKLVSSMYDDLVYIKDEDAKRTQEENKLFKELDKKFQPYSDEWSDAFNKCLKELDNKYKTQKYVECKNRIDEKIKEIESAMTAAEIKKLPKRGGYNHNLIAAFLEKYK